MIVDPTIASSGVFSLQINGITNPLSVQQAGNWLVATKNLVGGVYYPVDSGTTTLGSYIPVNGILTQAGTGGLLISSRTTYLASAQYQFLVILENGVP